MSRRVIRGIALPLFLLCLSAATAESQDFCTPRAVYRTGVPFGDDPREIDLFVQDDQGRGIPGALVKVEGGWTASTDDQGLTTIELQPGMQFPLTVNLKAAGFEDDRLLIVPRRDPCVVAHMRRAVLETGEGLTVRAGELQRSVQKESRDLQTKALDALHKGDYGEAEELLHRAVELTPSSASAHTNLGIVYLHRNDLEQAAESFEKAVRAAPYNPLTVENLGIVRWLQGRQKESYELLSRADSQGYSTETGNYIVGVWTLMRGFADSAAAHLKKVNPKRYVYRDLFLSLAERTRGKVKAAESSYRRFIERKPAPLWQAVLADTLINRG